MFSRAVPRLSSLSTSRLTALHRSIHSRVPLDYALEAGVGSFLSPKALKTVAVDWQEGVLNKLNTLTRGKSAPSALVQARLGRPLMWPPRATFCCRWPGPRKTTKLSSAHFFHSRNRI